MHVRRLGSLFKEAFAEFSHDKASRLGAALAYYTLFSLAPLLLNAVAVAGWASGAEAAQGQVVAQLQGILGTEAAEAVESTIVHARVTGGGTIAVVAGVGALIFGATNVFLQLQDALNTIWNVEEEKAGIKGLIINRLLSLSMVLAVGFLLLAGMLVNALISGAAVHAEGVIPVPPGVLMLLSLTMQIAITTLLFAAIFKVLPDRNLRWRDVWFGSLATAILFMIGQAFIAYYLGSTAVASAYGAAGSLVILLVWIYYSAQLLLFGGELTYVYAGRYGSLAGDGRTNQWRAPTHVSPPSGETPSKRSSICVPLFSGFIAGILIGRRTA